MTSRIRPVKRVHEEEDTTRAQFLDEVADNVSALAGSVTKITTPATPDTEFNVRHKLGQKPEECHILMSNLGGNLYVSSPLKWTTTLAFLKYTKGQDKITMRFR